MIKRIYYWLFPDWKTIKVLHGNWTSNKSGSIWDVAIYKIQYSKGLNKYRLKLSGYWPLKHPQYETAIEYLNYYEKHA